MKRRTVIIRFLSGVEYEVPAIAVCGALCVTKFYKYDALFDGPEWDKEQGYRVTHIPTGFSVFDIDIYFTRKQAVAAMRKLAALDGWEAATSAGVKKNKALKKAVREIEAELEKQ